MPDVFIELEEAYRELRLGGDAPDQITIWCDYYQHRHFATFNGNIDFCSQSIQDIREGQKPEAIVPDGLKIRENNKGDTI